MISKPADFLKSSTEAPAGASEEAPHSRDVEELLQRGEEGGGGG